MKTKMVCRKSIFPADIGRVFSLLKKLETLQYIAKPYASFTPVNGTGNHTIHVVEFSRDGIYTNESNTHVPVWNHRIILNTLPDERTEYSDEVEIGAGWKTGVVWLWAKLFIHTGRKSGRNSLQGDKLQEREQHLKARFPD